LLIGIYILLIAWKRRLMSRVHLFAIYEKGTKFLVAVPENRCIKSVWQLQCSWRL